MTQYRGSPCALLAAVGCSAHVPLAPHCALKASCSALAEAAGRVYQDHVAHLELFSFSRERKRERELAFVLETASQRENERCLTEKKAIPFHTFLVIHFQTSLSGNSVCVSIYSTVSRHRQARRSPRAPPTGGAPMSARTAATF